MSSLGRWILLLTLLIPMSARAEKIRIVTADPSKTGNVNYDSGEGARILKGIAPDIALLQEFNVGSNTPAQLGNFVATTFGSGFSYVRGSTTTMGAIPTGIVSRYPIISQGEWDDILSSNRDFTWAQLDIPGDKNLWVVSVHFSTVTAATRNNQATALVGLILANIPATDYLVVGGNFNAQDRTESQFATLAAVVGTAAPYPADQAGNENTNNGRTRPYDSVFSNAALPPTPVAIGGGSFANGLVVDTRVFTPLSALSPAVSADSAALSHTPVVKDFLVPSGTIRVTGVAFTLTAPAHGTVTFLSVPNVVYQVQASSTLAAGSWTPIGSILATTATTSLTIVAANATSGQLTDPPLATAPKRFYRIIQP